MKTKLLVVSTSYPKYQNDFNGSFVHELNRRLAQDFDVHVVAPSAPGLTSYCEFDQVKIHRFKQALFKDLDLAYGIGINENLKRNKLLYFILPLFFLSEMICLFKVVRQEKIGIIHAHWLIPNGLLCALYKKIFNKNIKVIATLHGSDWMSIGTKVIKRLALSGCDALTAVSPALKDAVIDFGYKGEIAVYPMGVDTKAFCPEKRDVLLKERLHIQGPFLLFVGVLVEAKGVRYLLEALPAVVEKFPQAKLVMVGTGKLKDELLQLVEKLNISDKVIFTGALPPHDLPAYFATADLFIHPSLSEGRALVVMEALSSGTLTIVADLPVYHSLAGQKEFLFMVPPRDPAALSRQIISLLTDTGQWSGRKAQGRLFAQRFFSWEETAKKYSEFMNRINASNT